MNPSTFLVDLENFINSIEEKYSPIVILSGLIDYACLTSHRCTPENREEIDMIKQSITFFFLIFKESKKPPSLKQGGNENKEKHSNTHH